MKLRTRTALVAAAILLASSLSMTQTPHLTPFSADMQIKSDQPPNPPEIHGKLYVDGGHMRYETQVPNKVGPIVLTNFATQTDDVLLPPMNAYIEHSMDDPHARGPALAMRDLRAYDPSNPCANQLNTTCKKLGTETVEGRSCDHWELTKKGEVVNVWIDQKLRFPIKTVTESSTVTLTKIKEGQPSPTLFQIPADYKKMSMNPQLGGSANQPPQR